MVHPARRADAAAAAGRAGGDLAGRAGGAGGCGLGAALGWLVFASVAAGYRALRGREGLGGGDAKLLAAAGAWLGWQALPQVMLLGAVAALVGAGVLRLARDGARLAFGPWLALAIWLVWLYGDIPG